jgi:hypothetical protein
VEEPDYVNDDSEDLVQLKLFKLHLSNLRKSQKPWISPKLHYKKAIEDYLIQMRILIQSASERRWPTIRIPQQVGFILTIPDEWVCLT